MKTVKDFGGFSLLKLIAWGLQGSTLQRPNMPRYCPTRTIPPPLSHSSKRLVGLLDTWNFRARGRTETSRLSAVLSKAVLAWFTDFLPNFYYHYMQYAEVPNPS